jgi:DNA repair protein RecO (recombination protein O)
MEDGLLTDALNEYAIFHPPSSIFAVMIQNATGLILRTRLLTETSLIVHWLTPEAGRIATVAKGARRAKSPFAGKLDLFYVADFSFTRSRSSQLHNLREVNLRETHGAIRQDMVRLQQAAYAAGFIEQATETDTPLPGIYQLLCGFLDGLCHNEPAPKNIFAFELKLLRELGLEPDWTQTNLAAGTKMIATALTENDWAACVRLKLTSAQTTELSQFLHGFLIFHLGRLPKGRAGALAD